jgi:3-oxoadipate enol-lactonase
VPVPEIRTTDGVEIAYQAWGKRDGTPCLMIQGLGVDSRGWALQRGSFGRRHRCVAVDNRGTGGSDAPQGPYDLLRMAEDAIEVLDAEGVDHAHVVGASMGGVIAQIIGVLHRDRVQSLTLACTACHHHDWRRELLQEWADVVTERGMRAMAEEDGMRWLVGPRLHRRFGVWINVLARVLMQTKPDAFVAQVHAILNASDELRNELHAIDVPTLVITGSQDTLTPVGDSEELAELIPTSRLYVLSGAAHGLMAEKPNAFNDAVLRFLDEVDADNRDRDDRDGRDDRDDRDDRQVAAS